MSGYSNDEKTTTVEDEEGEEDEDTTVEKSEHTTDKDTTEKEKTTDVDTEEVRIDEIIPPKSSSVSPPPEQPSPIIIAPPQTEAPTPITSSTMMVISPSPVMDPATEAAIPPPITTPKKPLKKSSEDIILGYGSMVPDKLFKKIRIKVKIPGGVKLKIELTKSIIISYIPDGSSAIGYLEAGDWIKAVDGTSVKTRRRVFTIISQKVRKEPYTIAFTVKRPLRNIHLTNQKQIIEYLPLAMRISPGYSYHLGNLMTYPGAKVGLRVKSFENKVYVSSISHGSLAEVTFNIGDVLLSIDDTPVTTVTEAHKRIQDALKMKKWVQTVIERPESKVALQRMNYALKAGRRLDIDPKMADDITGIVDKELKRMKDNTNKEPMKSILRTGDKPLKSLKFSSTSRETPILCDPVNLKLLVKVPKMRPPSRHRQGGQSRNNNNNSPNGGGGFGKGTVVRHLKTPNGIAYTEWIPPSTASSSSSTTQRSSTSSPASDDKDK